VNLLSVAGWTVRVAGLVVLVLGLVVWTGAYSGAVPIHMLAGIVLVAGLWAVALLAARAGASTSLVAVAIGWGLLTVAFGLTQSQLLPGDAHVVVEVAHLVVGLVAIGRGEMLTARARRGAVTT
jgi:hypothetical protein